MLHLKLAECPVNNITVITPPAETDLNLENKAGGLESATTLSRIFRITP